MTDVRRGTSLCQEFHETLDIGDSLYTKVHSDRSTTAKLIVTAYVKISLQDKTPALGGSCFNLEGKFLNKRKGEERRKKERKKEGGERRKHATHYNLSIFHINSRCATC